MLYNFQSNDIFSKVSAFCRKLTCSRIVAFCSTDNRLPAVAQIFRLPLNSLPRFKREAPHFQKALKKNSSIREEWKQPIISTCFWEISPANINYIDNKSRIVLLFLCFFHFSILFASFFIFYLFPHTRFLSMCINVCSYLFDLMFRS